jgi:diguanylate cyclase (GGDEF)-like protein/PAS domain S-box-containing protein
MNMTATSRFESNPAAAHGAGAVPPVADGATSHFAGLEVDLPAGATWCSPQLLALCGLPAGSAGIDALIGACAPEHRPVLRALIDDCARAGQPGDARIEIGGAGARRLALRVSARAVHADDGSVMRIYVAFQQIDSAQAAPVAAPTLAGQLADTLETMSEAFFTVDTAMRFTYLNPTAARLLRRDRADLLGKLMWEEFPAAVGGPSYWEYGRALREQRIASYEEFYPPLQCWFEVRGYPTADGLAVYFHDITERKQARIALSRSHRALQMLSRCNHVVMHAQTEAALIGEICRVAVEVGGYRLAWVGHAGQDALVAAAEAGADADLACLRRHTPGWPAFATGAGGPAALALRDGEPVVVDDLAQDLRFARWTAAESACGFGAAIYLPLRDSARAFGLLALYAHAALNGDAEEIVLLQELANNLAFGMASLRARLEQEKMQAAVTKVAASVSSATGEHFFEQLASTMADAVGADGGFIARLLPTDPPTARTVIAMVGGERVADFTYAVATSPCELALERGHYVVPAGVDHLFPDSPAAALGAKAYCGWRLHDSAGQPIGFAFVIFRQPVPGSGFVTSALRIFAARAAAELEREDADTNLRTQASLLDKAQDAIIVRGLDDRVRFWNKSAERMYGWTRAEILGRTSAAMFRGDADGYAAAKAAAIESGHWSGEAVRYCKDGTPLTVEVRLSLIRNDHGEPDSLLSINTDISQRKAAEREIERLAFYDGVTGLPNRQLLLDRLEHALTIAGRSGATGALLFIDLDHFKSINDTLGHDKGDQLLQEVARRLRTCVYEIDTVARFGGDEFVVLVENLSKQRHDAATQARHICEKIQQAFAPPIMLARFVRHTTASIGVTLFDSQQCGANELLKQADLAMYEVKAAGRNGVRFFDPEMQTVVSARAALEADLRDALRRDEFLLHYQPQVDRDGAVIGAEALIRWQSPSRGQVAPVDFIGVAEETGLIVPMGRWVLGQACRQLALWAQQTQLAALSISVNVSPHQLRQPGFADQVYGALAQAGADPSRLKLEITESMLVNDSDASIGTMHELKQHGVGFSLDDFGTGYSSLSYLKRLPLDQLKIDQSFVSEVQSNPHDAAIAQTILGLGRCLHLNVIAEGVETAGQHAFLMEHGCHAFQGYYFSRPVPIDAFEAFARARSF